MYRARQVLVQALLAVCCSASATPIKLTNAYFGSDCAPELIFDRVISRADLEDAHGHPRPLTDVATAFMHLTCGKPTLLIGLDGAVLELHRKDGAPLEASVVDGTYLGNGVEVRIDVGASQEELTDKVAPGDCASMFKLVRVLIRRGSATRVVDGTLAGGC